MTNPYAVPLDRLLDVRVPAERQVTEQPAPGVQHVQDVPLVWTPEGLQLGVADGGGGGDC